MNNFDMDLLDLIKCNHKEWVSRSDAINWLWLFSKYLSINSAKLCQQFCLSVNMYLSNLSHDR